MLSFTTSIKRYFETIMGGENEVINSKKKIKLIAINGLRF
jgi:hypothetical protein